MRCITVREISLAPFRRDLTRDECNFVSISKLAASSSPTESSMTASWSKMERCIKADRRHGRNCIFFQPSVSVHANMTEPNEVQTHEKRPIPQGDQRRYTGAILLRTRPKTYRAIARERAEPDPSVNGISRRYRVSNHTVMGIREREAKSIAERKNTLAAKLANVAELGAERMEETIGKAGLRDAAIGTGIAADKMLAMTDQTASLNGNVAN